MTLCVTGFANSCDDQHLRDPWRDGVASGQNLLQHLPGQQKPGQSDHSQGNSHTDAQCYLQSYGAASCEYCVCVCVCTHAYVYVHVCACVCVCVCVHTCVGVCMCMCVQASIYVGVLNVLHLVTALCVLVCVCVFKVLYVSLCALLSVCVCGGGGG